MDLPVVVGADGSESSLRAVDWAADEAALHGAPLRLVHASLWQRYESGAPTSDPDEQSEHMLEETIHEAAERRARRRQPGVTVTTDVLPEDPDHVLVRESRTALAVVLGCRGRSGVAEALLGSVGLTVAGHAYCPVIVVRGSHDDAGRPGAPGRIVLGVGGKPRGSAAVRFAVQEASLRGVPLDAVRAWRHSLREPAHAEQQQQAVELLEEVLLDVPAEPSVHCHAVEGNAPDALVAASHEAGLLVVGARRRPGHQGLRLGQVAHSVLHHAACPVAVVPELS